MNPELLYTLTTEQKERYCEQPDSIEYQRDSDGECELLQYVKGTTMRFWYNTQSIDYSTHWHSAMEIIVPIENEYTVKSHQQVYTLRPGDIMVIPPGELHSLHSPVKGSRLILLFELDQFNKMQGFSYFLSLLSMPLHMSFNTHSAVYEKEISLLMKAADYYWSDAITRELHIYAFLSTFFANYADYCFPLEADTQSPSLSIRNNLTNKLNIVFDYLDEHYSENVTLDEVAAIAGFSKFHFSRLFKQCTNQTLFDYLSARRIRTAERLLISQNLTITEISYQSGFSSLSSFNRNFKRLKGCTPTEYRSLSHPSIHS